MTLNLFPWVNKIQFPFSFPKKKENISIKRMKIGSSNQPTFVNPWFCECLFPSCMDPWMYVDVVIIDSRIISSHLIYLKLCLFVCLFGSFVIQWWARIRRTRVCVVYVDYTIGWMQLLLLLFTSTDENENKKNQGGYIYTTGYEFHCLQSESGFWIWITCINININIATAASSDYVQH